MPNPTSDLQAGVVFTGAQGRVEEAMCALTDGKIDYLHISGWDPDAHDLKEIMEKYDCPASMISQISYDNAATTQENGIMTAEWMQKNNFDNITLITSDSHGDRAMTELFLGAQDVGIDINIKRDFVDDLERSIFDELTISGSEWIKEALDIADTMVPDETMQGMILKEVVDRPSVEDVMDRALYQNMYNDGSTGMSSITHGQDEYYVQSQSAVVECSVNETCSVASTVMLETDSNYSFAANFPDLAQNFSDSASGNVIIPLAPEQDYALALDTSQLPSAKI